MLPSDLLLDARKAGQLPAVSTPVTQLLLQLARVDGKSAAAIMGPGTLRSAVRAVRGWAGWGGIHYPQRAGLVGWGGVGYQQYWGVSDCVLCGSKDLGRVVWQDKGRGVRPGRRVRRCAGRALQPCNVGVHRQEGRQVGG